MWELPPRVRSSSYLHVVYLTSAEVPKELANTLEALLASNPVSDGHTHRNQRVAQYAPRYRLAFSLLNEDAAAGGAASGWSVAEAIAREHDHQHRAVTIY